jgi:hypothetical protein
MAMTSELMPAGKPNFKELKNYPTIAQLTAEYGKYTMLKVIHLMVVYLCNSINVVRNMNEDQKIEAAHMLLNECGNFRLEDYQMLFAMGKRGTLVKIMDRLDIQVVTKMLDEYWKLRHQAGEQLYEEELRAAEANTRYTPPRGSNPDGSLTPEEAAYEHQQREMLHAVVVECERLISENKKAAEAARQAREEERAARAATRPPLIITDHDLHLIRTQKQQREREEKKMKWGR